MAWRPHNALAARLRSERRDPEAWVAHRLAGAWVADRASDRSGQGCRHHAEEGHRDHISGPVEVWFRRTSAADSRHAPEFVYEPLTLARSDRAARSREQKKTHRDGGRGARSRVRAAESLQAQDGVGRSIDMKTRPPAKAATRARARPFSGMGISVARPISGGFRPRSGRTAGWRRSAGWRCPRWPSSSGNQDRSGGRPHR